MQIKSFSKNTLFYAIGIIAIRFTTFLLIPLYTEFLSKEEYGLLATLLFTTEIIITINDVGIRSAIMRFFAEYNKINKLAELIGSSVFVNIIVGVIIILISLLISESYLSNLFQVNITENVILLTILVGVSRTLSLNILSYFRAKNLGSAYMLTSIVSSSILVFTTWISLQMFNMGINGVLYAQIFSFGIAWIFVLIWIFKKDGLKIDTNTSKMLFKFGYPLILATSGTMLVTTTGNYFLGAFRNLEEVAVLAIAYKVGTVGIMVLIAPFQLAYEPYVFNNKDNPDLNKIISKIITYIVLLYLLVSIAILFAFKYLFEIIGNGDYTDAYYYVFLLIPALGFTAINYIGQSLIHLKNKTKTTGLISFAVTILSIVISYFATNLYGIYGTILGINFYLITSGILLFYFGNNEFPIKIELQRLLIITVSGIILFVGLYILSSFSNLIFYSFSSILIITYLTSLYLSNFFNKNEKEIVRSLFSNWRTYLKLG
ncbi:MAG: oligosaccharide flippase family protein [Ignavibacteriae bacterium]|nr:oligosaccharide flippase family protein [Ignavibacteriota bacterium]MCB9219799.1 oligosaccharide flippase family protein [Ignavibacteriales bacterium]